MSLLETSQQVDTSLKAIKVHSELLNLDYNVYIQDQTVPSQQKCHVLTLHDLGCDHTSFFEFISCNEMKGLKDRIIWIHVDLPGQEPDAAELSITKYPDLHDIAQELINVLDHLKINKVTCLGEGCGANVASRFAMIHPTRCNGVALVHPTGSPASLMEHFKEKLTHILPQKSNNGIGSSVVEYLIWHRFGSSNYSDQLIAANIKEFQQRLNYKRNSKNLGLLIDAYLNRSNITEKLGDLKVDVFIANGKKSSSHHETKKFAKALYESRKDNKKLTVNCPILNVDEVGDVIGESPDKLALALQYFLQGLGLLTAMPMRKDLKGLGRLSRAFSMEEADRPRRMSQYDPSLSTTTEVN